MIPGAAGYVYRLIPSLWPFYAFIVLRQTLQAHHRTGPIVVTIIVANVLNVVLNYVWVYGQLGFAAHGVFGSAWATTMSRWVMAAMMLALGWRYIRPYLERRAPNLLDPRPLGRMLRLGSPIGAQMVLEVGAFGAVALFMGWLGVDAGRRAPGRAESRVAHVHGAARRVGGGRGDRGARGRARRRRGRAPRDLGRARRRRGFHGVHGGAADRRARRCSRASTRRDAAVIALAALLLPIAGVFQVFDGLQVVAIGLLRGLGDTRVPVIVNIVGFWCIGMPVSLWLGFGLGYGAVGLWWGSSSGS